MASVKFTNSGLSEMIAEFHALRKPPLRAVAALEDELYAAYRGTQAATHVLTGSLKASGRVESSFHGDVWEGTITYGGASTGVNNPVTYSIYERARGGAHDFMAPAVAREPKIEAVLHSNWVDLY